MTRLSPVCRKAVALATNRGKTIATAESLTGGWIATALAGVPGASKVLLGGVVSYDPRIKRELLGVSQDVLDGVGVVSAACAEQMAQGARNSLKADIALSATGLAGPGGGTAQTPVGTVFLGIASEKGTRAEEHHFRGSRQAVRKQAVLRALTMLVNELTNE